MAASKRTGRTGVVAGVLLLFSSGAAHAQNDGASMLAFAQSHNCMSCHAIKRDFMGPSFDRVARKYGQNADASAELARRIVEGGVGVWGPVPMPANTQISPDQAVALADWILSLQ